MYKNLRCLLYVHCEERRLCLVDALWGVSAGFAFGYQYEGALVGYLGAALIGGVVGGLIGKLNYELVLVRWLRLIPSRR